MLIVGSTWNVCFSQFLKLASTIPNLVIQLVTTPAIHGSTTKLPHCRVATWRGISTCCMIMVASQPCGRKALKHKLGNPAQSGSSLVTSSASCPLEQLLRADWQRLYESPSGFGQSLLESIAPLLD